MISIRGNERRVLSFIGFCGGLAVCALLALSAALRMIFPPMPPGPGLFDAVRRYDEGRLVFPGAEGFGADTRAGRGGKILRVNTLAADGPGSLRAALSEAGPRIIVFEVAGIIDIKEELVVTEPYVTIAGQTAPPPGLTIIGAGMRIATHDVLMQHMRIRPGDRPDGPHPDARDALALSGADSIYNVFIDHCSFSWAIDEGTSTWGPGGADITFRQCIIAENLSRSLHPKVEHSKGLLIGDHTRRIAVIGNLFAHNMNRNPYSKGDVSALLVNNLIYDPGNMAIHYGDPDNSGPLLSAAIGNVFIPGPSTHFWLKMLHIQIDVKPASEIYAMDNNAGGIGLYRAWRARSSWRPIFDYSDSRIRVEPLRIRPSSDVIQWVTETAGAWPAARDVVDSRIVEQVRSRSGRIIDSQNDVGGFPQADPIHRPLRIPEDPHAPAGGGEYTAIDLWLCQLAAAAEKAEANSLGDSATGT